MRFCPAALSLPFAPCPSPPVSFRPHPSPITHSDPTALMAPPLDPEKAKALMKNPWASQLIEKDIELLKLEKKKKEEEE